TDRRSGPEPAGADDAPHWPLAADSDERWPMGGRLASLRSRSGPRSRPGTSARMTVVALVVGGSVLLLGVLSVLAQTGLFALGGRTAGTAPGTSSGPSSNGTGVLGTPTAALSPTSGASWLQVAPNSVQLGCDDATRTQVVVLANRGPKTVRWEVTVPPSQ